MCAMNKCEEVFSLAAVRVGRRCARSGIEEDFVGHLMRRGLDRRFMGMESSLDSLFLLSISALGVLGKYSLHLL